MNWILEAAMIHERFDFHSREVKPTEAPVKPDDNDTFVHVTFSLSFVQEKNRQNMGSRNKKLKRFELAVVSTWIERCSGLMQNL